jgi:Fe-S cluster biogenesis protein NfuA
MKAGPPKSRHTFWGIGEVDMITREQVEGVLDKIRVGLKTEGGDIELIEVKDDIVYVRLMGACGTCPMSTLTMKNWVETTIKKEIPEVKAVQAV